MSLIKRQKGRKKIDVQKETVCVREIGNERE